MTRGLVPHGGAADLPYPAEADPSAADPSPWRQRFNVIHKTVRERITLLHYPPGMRIDIDALADEYGVSRTPIRNVLQRLETEGMVITRHGVGTMVTQIDFGHLREATLLRMHLAELIGTLSPRRPDPDIPDRLDQLRQECVAILGSPAPQEFARIDIQLHDCKSGLIGNSMLYRIYDELYFRTVRMWFHFLPRVDWQTEVSCLADDIGMSASALRRGDVRAVGLITRNAISGGLFRIDDLLAEAENP